MKALSRHEVRLAFYDTVKKYGKPTSGKIFCENQLIAAIVSNLSAYDETNIIYQYGRFEVSPGIAITSEYAKDYVFIGTVKAKDWFTSEQLKALHELAFGYQF